MQSATSEAVKEKKEEEKGETAVFRPFHETVVDAIHRCHSPNSFLGSTEILRLLLLIDETKIPRGHQEIIDAIDDFSKKHRLQDLPSEWGVAPQCIEITKELVLKQRQEAEEEQARKKESINLDELQREVEYLLSLLVDRHRGKVSWEFIMQNHLQKLHKLTSLALGES